MSNGQPNHAPLAELCAVLRDGEITRAQFAALSQLLREDRESVRYYLRHMTLTAMLEHDGPAVSRPLAESAVRGQDARAAWNERLAASLRRMVGFFTRPTPLALTVAAAVMGLLITAMAFIAPPIYRQMSHGDGFGEAPRFVARLSDVHEAVWAPGQIGANRGAHLVAGHRMQLQRGFAEIEFSSGAMGLLEGPADLTLLESNLVRLASGRLVVTTANSDAAPGGIFTVDTPAADVVDVGTEFGVAALDESTDVHVYQGRVEVAAKRDGEIVGARRQVRAGESVQVAGAAIAPLDRTVAVDRLIRSIGEVGPLIAFVRSNTNNIYRVAPTPLREDAVSHTDRPYQWNGVTAEGMPTYLVGATYVQTCMADNVNGSLRVEMQVRRDCTLYLFVTDRGEPPAWVASDFEPTGDKIGSDTNVYDDFGVGPGESINAVYNVWRRTLAAGETVELRQPQFGNDQGIGNYGIAVVPRNAAEGDQ